MEEIKQYEFEISRRWGFLYLAEQNFLLFERIVNFLFYNTLIFPLYKTWVS